MKKENKKYPERALKIKLAALCAALMILITGLDFSAIAQTSSWTSRLEDFTGYGGAEYYKKSGYYVNIYGPGGMIEEVRYKAGGSRQRLYYLTNPDTGEEQTAYCLASGLSFSTGAGYGADLDEPNSFSDYFGYLPESARKGIAYATIYGFSEKTMSLYDPGLVEGTLGTDFWMATQCIIWEYQQGIRTDAGMRRSVGQVAADNYYSMIKGKPAEKCYDYLLDLIARASALPSFAADNESGWNNTIILNETFAGMGIFSASVYSKTTIMPGSYIITDENGAQVPGLSITVYGNSVTLTATRPFPNGKKIIVRRSDEGNSEGSAVFFGPEDPGKQTMISTGGKLDEPFVMYLCVKTQDSTGDRVRFRIEKSSGDGKIEGIPFVFAWESSGSQFNNRIVYTDADGVAKTDFRIGNDPEDIMATNKAVAVMEYPSDRYISSLTKESGNILISSYVYFYRAVQNGNEIWKYDFNESEAAGKAADGLTYRGRYIFIGSGNSEKNILLEYYNEPLKGTLKLIKQAETGGGDGFEFELAGQDPENAHIILRKTTGSDGTAIWDELLPGTYILREILGEGSIWEEPEPLTVTVEANKTAVVTLTNMRKKGSIKIIKTSDDDIFDGVRFVISDASGTLATIEPDEDSVQVINGRNTFVAIVSGLTPGTYTVTEIVPDRYKPQLPVTVTVESNKTAEAVFHNELELAGLTVTKAIYAEEFIPAHGDATFIIEIRDVAENKTYYRALTFGREDKLGAKTGLITKSFTMEDLKPGQYEVRELKTLRYELESVTADPASRVDSNMAILNVRSGEDGAWALFVNVVINQEKTSHTAICENRFGSGD